LPFFNNLGWTYLYLGQLTKAKELQRIVLDNRKRILDNEYLDTFRAMKNINLASMDNALDLSEEAERLEVVVLNKRKKLLDDHIDTLAAANNLGWTWYCKGDFVRAEELQSIVLEKHRMVEGKQQLKHIWRRFNSLQMCFKI
ncbi:hypothetical protein C8R45DRAFT_842794, partial [Mycena sanguinolenta]